MMSKSKTNRRSLGKGFLSQPLYNESGIALISALLFMVVLISLVPAAMHLTSGEMNRTTSFKENRQAFFIAEAGLEHAKFLTEQSSVRDALIGPDEKVYVPTIPTNTQNAVSNDDDNGTFDTGTVVARFGSIYSEVLYKGNTYYIRAEDNDDGDDNPLSDSDFLMVVSSVGIVDDTTTRVEATIYYPTIPVSALTTNGNLQMSGTPNILGACGAAHANGDLDINGNPEVALNATSSGGLTTSGSMANITGTPVGSQPQIPVPYLNPSDYQQYADYTLKADGTILDSDGNPVTPSPGFLDEWDFASASSPDLPTWKLSGNDSTDASYYVEGNIEISGTPPGPGNPPWEVTFFATGSIKLSGNADFINRKDTIDDPVSIQNLFMVAGLDIDYSGNPSNILEGIIYAGEQIELSGNGSIEGAVMAFNANAGVSASPSGLITENLVNGNPTITYGCGLTFPNSGGVQVVSWNEVSGESVAPPPPPPPPPPCPPGGCTS